MALLLSILRLALLVSVLALMPSEHVLAGAWTLEPGSGQAIVSGFYAEASDGFGADGGLGAIPVFRKAEARADIEYGIAEGWTAIARGELKSAATGSAVRLDEARFGLAGIGMRTRLWRGERSVLSFEATGRVAVGAKESDEEGDLDLRLLGGHSFEIASRAAFVDLQGAYRMRFGAVEDEVRADLTFGIRPKERVLLLAQSFNAISVDGVFREHKVKVGVVYDMSAALALEIAGIATVAGRNALREQGIVTAVWYRF